MDVQTIIKTLLLTGVVAFGFANIQPANALDIELLINQSQPVPTMRPDTVHTGSIQAKPLKISLVSSGKKNSASPIKGSLKDGLKALSKKDVKRALGIRAWLAAGSLDRKILAWSIAISGMEGVLSGEISSIASDLPTWPGQ
jgi:soluble lytic murein transglycosylase